jgi:hypothetical protein
MDTMQQKWCGGNGAISPKNSQSDQTKWVDHRRGCGGEDDGNRSGVAFIFFV